MHKVSTFNFLLSAIIILLFNSCLEEDNLPKPDFTANHFSSTNKEIKIAFTDLSTNGADEWIWTFEGGSPAISYERDPIVSYDEAGTFNVTLTVRNGHGSREVTKFDYINVGDFFNPTWEDIYVTHHNENRLVPIDDYILLAEINNPIISYYGETYGRTAVGGQVGLLIYWNESVNINEALYWDFIIEDIYVFINVQNYGPVDFYPFIVNWGDPEYEIVDYITIPNDGLWWSTGYYDAWDFMEIRALINNNPDDYVGWIEGTHFDLLWVVNQGLDLWYDGSKSNLKSKTKSKSHRSKAKPIIQSGSKRKNKEL